MENYNITDDELFESYIDDNEEIVNYVEIDHSLYTKSKEKDFIAKCIKYIEMQVK